MRAPAVRTAPTIQLNLTESLSVDTHEHPVAILPEEQHTNTQEDLCRAQQLRLFCFSSLYSAE